MSTSRRGARSPRLDRRALKAVLVSEAVAFRPYWRATTFENTFEPTVYLLAFGFGFGSLLRGFSGGTYLDFVATGVVAAAVLNASMLSAAYRAFIKCVEHNYEAMLSAPVDASEVVTGEAMWIGARCGVYSAAPLLVASALGLRPTAGVFVVPLLAAAAAFGWACFGMLVGVKARRVETFSYVQSGLGMPLVLLGGIFFPLDALPTAVQDLALANPVFHCVELVRHATFGFRGWVDVGHVAFLVVFALVAWRLAIRALERRLIV